MERIIMKNGSHLQFLTSYCFLSGNNYIKYSVIPLESIEILNKLNVLCILG